MEKAAAAISAPKSAGFLYFSVFAVNLASFTTGIALAWSSPSIPRLNGVVDADNNPLPVPITTSEESLIASLIAIGGMISPFVAGIAADKIGRKKALMYLTVPIYLSFVLIYFATSVWFFYVARFLAGISVGAHFVILPNYVAEFSESHNRGSLSCVLGTAITLGILLVYSVGPYVTVQNACLVYLIAPTLLFIIVGVFVPESFYYLLVTQNEPAAQKSLNKLRKWNSADIRKEIHEINTGLKESDDESGFLDLFKQKSLRKGITITFGLISFQQFAGINAILFYMQTIFEATGSKMSAESCTILIGVVQFLGAVVTPLIVDRLGRRILLFTSEIGTMLSLLALGAFFHIKANGSSIDSISWLPVTSLIIYIISFTIGFGPIAWTLLGEIFPGHAKSAAATLTVALSFFLTFGMTVFFPYLLAFLGTAKSFWLFAASCGASLIFTYLIVPETKGKTFSEIQEIMRN